MLQVQRNASQAISSVLAGASLTDALEAIWKRSAGLTTSERGAIQDISYGTLRHLGTLRAILRALAPKPVSPPALECVLLAALYQLEFTQAAPYAIVDHAVECAGRAGGTRAKPFANAVLRNFQRRRDALLAQARADGEGRFSHAPWWIDKLVAELGADAEVVMDVDNLHPPMALRVNIRRGTAAGYLQRLAAAGIDANLIRGQAIRIARPVPIERLPGFTEGDVSVQDAGAQLAAPLLDVRAGMRVLDACAAPGGKAAHILELADVNLTALDIDGDRLRKVRANLDRLGLSGRTLQADAAVLESWWDGRPFERVMLDAPCSGSGVVRRHPDIKWLRRPTDLPVFAAQQARLLEALWKVLAPGGKLLYVTCSIFGEEDHETTKKFAARHPDASLEGGMPGRDGLLLPDHEHDGFYYALLRKD